MPNGRGGGIRTPDPLVPNQMRYQTALRPDWYQFIPQPLSWLYITNRFGLFMVGCSPIDSLSTCARITSSLASNSA